MDFSGTYFVVSSPDFFIAPGETSRITLRQEGEFARGEFEFAAQYGEMNGGVHSGFIEFDFHGNDEMEEASGDGEATLEGDWLTFILRYHRGDEFIFECERKG